LAYPQNQDTGSRNPYFAGSADVGISAVLPTHYVSISILFSSCENIPALSGANCLFADVGRHRVGAITAENRIQTSFSESANRLVCFQIIVNNLVLVKSIFAVI